MHVLSLFSVILQLCFRGGGNCDILGTFFVVMFISCTFLVYLSVFSSVSHPCSLSHIVSSYPFYGKSTSIVIA